MQIIIPVWFYGFDSAMYFISSMIGFLLAFYFHRIYSLSSEKRHMYLYLGFLLLSIGLLSLSITSVFSYIVFKNCRPACALGLIDDAFSLEDFAYLLYFGLSIAAYTLFIFAYRFEEFKLSKYLILLFFGYLILVAAALPIKKDYRLWDDYHEFFHLTALIMMIFIVFKNIVNYIEKKSLNCLLVTISFAFIFLFHLFHLFSFLSGWMYVFAHISMLTGFSVLLYMVSRVKKK
jgi:hypothetical protein